MDFLRKFRNIPSLIRAIFIWTFQNSSKIKINTKRQLNTITNRAISCLILKLISSLILKLIPYCLIKKLLVLVMNFFCNANFCTIRNNFNAKCSLNLEMLLKRRDSRLILVGRHFQSEKWLIFGQCRTKKNKPNYSEFMF